MVRRLVIALALTASVLVVTAAPASAWGNPPPAGYRPTPILPGITVDNFTRDPACTYTAAYQPLTLSTRPFQPVVLDAYYWRDWPPFAPPTGTVWCAFPMRPGYPII
jgi:hypothetical protein